MLIQGSTCVYSRKVEFLYALVFQTLDLIAKIFHDLNYQDIPEVFEDNLDTWMAGFHSLLTLPAPVTALVKPEDEDEKLSSMHAMQRSLCEALRLYADKVPPRSFSLSFSLSLSPSFSHSPSPSPSPSPSIALARVAAPGPAHAIPLAPQAARH